MGKRGRGGRGRGGRRGGKNQDNKGDGTDGSGKWKHEPWTPLHLNNDLFNEYYKGLGIVPEGEWDAFHKALQAPLPTTFRVTASGYFATVLRERIQQAGYHNPESYEIEGELVEPPRPISWYPNKLAWYTSIPRKVLKSNSDFENFHKFLVSQGDQGNITRQEAVSMLPPLFLDVQPHHTVLDMCAAPGSKTTQIIEQLHAGTPGQLPRGLVIANDVEKNRCYMLVHHTKRLASPAIVVTNNPAQSYPRLPIRLDRILADVPCSGDGTMRKNIDIWRRWQPLMGLGLHTLQVRIAYRAAQMLAVGGRMVYSTCSLNPSEDEAVVMELLRQTGGAMELVNVSSLLPDLKYSPGLATWRVMDKDTKWYSSFDDVPESSRNRLRKSTFPPTPEEAKMANLHFCLRILPHLQNTGGFFIAVLHKKEKIPQPGARGRDEAAPAQTTQTQSTGAAASARGTVAAPAQGVEVKKKVRGGNKATAEKKAVNEDEDVPLPLMPDEVTNTTNDDEDAAERPAKRIKERTWIEEPFLALSSEMLENIKALQEFYGLVSLPIDQLFSRSTKNHKIYFVTESIADLINKVQAGEKTGLTIVNSGVKLFHRHQQSENGYRVCQESVQWVLPMITKRRVTITHADLLRMLLHGQIYPNNFSQPAEAALNALPQQGCVVFVVDPTSNEPSSGMGFVAWFSKKTVQLLVKKKELNSLRNLFCPKEPEPTQTTTTTTTTTTTSEDQTTSATSEQTTSAQTTTATPDQTTNTTNESSDNNNNTMSM